MRATIAIAAIGVVAVVWRVDTGSHDVPAAPSTAPPAAASSSIGAGPAASRPAPLVRQQSTPLSHHTVAAPGVTGVEAAVRKARQDGKGEQEVHRLRSAALPAAQVEAIARMEAAEADWRRRMDALHSACSANLGCEDARASFTQEELARATAYAAPTLRQ